MARLKNLDTAQASDKSQALLRDLESKKQLLNVFRAMANSPAVLDGYLKFRTALQAGKLDAKTRAAIALAVAQSNRCDYCLAAHALLGKEAGLDAKSIQEARLGRAADARTAAAVTLAKKLTDAKGNVSDSDLAAARAGGLDDADVAEVVANVALNIFTNYFNHVNQTEVDLPKVSTEVG